MSSREVGALAPTCTAYAKKGFSSEELVSVNQNFQTVLAQFPVSPSCEHSPERKSSLSGAGFLPLQSRFNPCLRHRGGATPHSNSG
jgi:hypothetical protein